MSDLLKRLSEGVLLADGAMGTMLHSHGVGFDKCFDELNLSEPAAVAQIHREYVEAGAQLLLSNTFGANRFKLSKHGLEGQVAEINRAGVELARRAVGSSSKDILIAADVGPLGVRIAPVRPRPGRTGARGFCRTDRSAVWVRRRLDRPRNHQRPVRDAGSGQGGKTGVRPASGRLHDIHARRPDRAGRRTHGGRTCPAGSAGADVIGVNCSGGPAQLLRILRLMRQAVPGGRFWVKPNAGWPEQVGGRIMYPADPDYFAEYAIAFRDAGAGIMGGCCGTTPQHIAAMRRALDSRPSRGSAGGAARPPKTKLSRRRAEGPTGFARKLAHGRFAISVEMDPPRGLSTHKLLAGASLLAEAGADVINVADSPMARMRMSAWAVCDIVQRRVNVETTLHFPTRGRNLLRVQGDLLAAHALGIRNVLVVMGDPTAIGDYPEAMDNYDLVPSGLIRLIKQGFNTGVDHSGASIGQPTNFYVGAALNLCAPEPEQEAKNLDRKVRAGADFFLTQPIYRAEDGAEVLARYQDRHGKLDKPVLVGVLPLVSLRHANFLNHEVPGISIPEGTIRRLEQAGEQAAAEGVRIAVELIEQIRPWAQGVYLMPQFSRFDLAAEIIDKVKVTESPA